MSAEPERTRAHAPRLPGLSHSSAISMGYVGRTRSSLRVLASSDPEAPYDQLRGERGSNAFFHASVLCLARASSAAGSSSPTTPHPAGLNKLHCNVFRDQNTTQPKLQSKSSPPHMHNAVLTLSSPSMRRAHRVTPACRWRADGARIA